MSPAAGLRPFDFQEVRRLAPATSRALSRWLTEACTLATEAWTSQSTYPLRVALGKPEPERTAAVLGSVPDPAPGVILQIAAQKLPTLLVWEPVLLQGLFADLLGAAAPSTSSAAELTVLEETLLELLVNRLRESLSDSWPGQNPLPCAFKELCRPRRTRRLSAYEEVISIPLRVESRFQTGDIRWLVPRRELEVLLEEVHPLVAGGESTHEMSSLVEQFPLDVCVELGQAQLSTAAMARLQVGDVLVLDQSLGRPLIARVTGQPLWMVEPCRVGQRQAIEVHSLLED